MSLVLDGTNGLSDIDGSAATPAIRGTDANTGIFFPAADTIAFAEGGTEVMRIDSSGNVGIGTSSPSYKLDVDGGLARFTRSSKYLLVNPNYNAANTNVDFETNTGMAFTFTQGTSERARIDTSGNLLVGTTSNPNSAAYLAMQVDGASKWARVTKALTTNAVNCEVMLNNSNTLVGSISFSTTATTYATSSDYRLKHDIQLMTGALAKVAALKPCTYKWNVDGSDGEGFIAHELAEVVPGCVTGEKDAVDAEGNPQYQGIDTSFLVATLTAAIQELKAIVDAQGAEIAALKGTQP